MECTRHMISDTSPPSLSLRALRQKGVAIPSFTCERLLQSFQEGPRNDEREEIFAPFYDLGKRGMCHQGSGRAHGLDSIALVGYD